MKPTYKTTVFEIIGFFQKGSRPEMARRECEGTGRALYLQNVSQPLWPLPKDDLATNKT